MTPITMMPDTRTASHGAPQVTESSWWISSPRGPLCVRMHSPADGNARGVVLLCPPVGREMIVTYRTYRQFAHRLAAEGLAALRLDYNGTGDSSGNQRDPDRTGAWSDSIRAGIVAARRVSLGPLTVVGMRMGGLLAAAAIAGLAEPVDRLLLWDPSPHGRGWMREQRALQAIGLGAIGLGAVRTDADEEEVAAASVGRDHLVDIPSWTFPEPEAQILSGLSIADTRGQLASEVVVYTRPNQNPDKRMAARLAGENTTWRTVPGQLELININPRGAVIPVEGIDMVATDISAATPKTFMPVRSPGTGRAAVTTALDDPRGDVVSEEHITLGPVGLVGVRTEAPRPLPGAPLIVLIAHSDESHVGPSRAWVELARLWALGGVSSVRFCVSGLGESPTRPGQDPDILFAAEALDDVLDAVRAAQPSAPDNVVLIGLCSGAYGAMEAALTLKVRGVCLIGLVPGAGALGTPDGGRDPRRQAVAPVHGWMWRGSQSRLAWKLARRLPQLTYTIADRMNVLPSPARPLRRLDQAGIHTLFIVGSRDARSYVTFAAAELKRLQRRGRLQFFRVPGLDHGMLRGGPRDMALELLDRYVREHFIQPFDVVATS